MPIGRVRPAIQTLASYRPGKAAAQAEKEHRIVDAIKLASNENPYSPISEIVEAVRVAAEGVNRYADHRAIALRVALGQWLGVDPAQITVGCGSVGLLQQLCLTYVDPGDEVVYPWLSFEAYPNCVKMMGGVPVNPPLVDHHFDMDAVAKAVGERTKMVLLASPNNPTGTAITTDQVAELLTSIPNNVMVVIDEAYREFARPELGDPVADLLPDHRNLIILRTFSKAYGMAGLRVGYAISDADIVTEIDKVLLPFAVTNLAQAGALAALGALDKIQPRIDLIIAERAKVVASLEADGWKPPTAEANFVYLPAGDRTDTVYLGLEQQGVVTRPFSGDGIRVTIGSPEENDRFLTTLANI